MAQKNQEQILRKLFLKSFINSLIKNSYVPSKEEKEILEKTAEEDFQSSIRSLQKKQPFHPPHHQPLKHPELPLLPPPNIKLPPLRSPPPPGKGQKQKSLNLGKITQFLLDPSIQSVECPGPGKNVHVNRSGSIQTTPIILTKEEVNTLMNEVSEKTRIPIMTGLFKAAIQDLLITAVVSEFVGTRFIIQKRTPSFQHR